MEGNGGDPVQWLLFQAVRAAGEREGRGIEWVSGTFWDFQDSVMTSLEASA